MRSCDPGGVVFSIGTSCESSLVAAGVTGLSISTSIRINGGSTVLLSIFQGGGGGGVRRGK